MNEAEARSFEQSRQRHPLIRMAEAKRMQLISSNPIVDVRPVSYTAPSRQILTLEEAKTLLDESKVGEFWTDEMSCTTCRLAS